MTSAVTTQPVQATSCWTSFTNGCSAALRQLAHGVAKLWSGIKHAAHTLYNAAAPFAAKAVQWVKLNPQTAAIGGLGVALAVAGGVYYCFCRNAAPKTPPADPNTTPAKA